MEIIDSYPIANRNIGYALNNTYTKYGQAFTGKAGNLSASVWWGYKVGSPTGNMYAKLYAATGTFGTDAKPTGAALATSDAIDVSTLSGPMYALMRFYFHGSDEYFFTEGTKYIMTIEYDNGDASNRVIVGADSSSPTHSGNWSYYAGGAWGASNTNDFIFYNYIFDQGVRIRIAGSTQRIKTEQLTAAHKVRIDVNGTVYGIPLVATGDATASPFRIYNGSAVKALVKVA